MCVLCCFISYHPDNSDHSFTFRGDLLSQTHSLRDSVLNNMELLKVPLPVFSSV